MRTVGTSLARHRALAAAVLAATVGVLPAFLAGGVAVQIRADLGIGAARFGLAIGAFFVGAALASRPLGRLTEHLGPSRGLRLSASCNAVALAAIAAGARSYPLLLLLLATGGAANGLTQPAANLMLARAIPDRRKGLAFGIKQSAVPAATMLAGVAVPAVALTVGWRWAFAAGAGLALVTVAIVPGHTESLTNGPEAEAVPGDGQAARATLVWMALGIGLGATAANALGSFLVSSGVAAGLANDMAGVLLTAGSLAGIAARLTAGALADRRDGGHLRVVGWMLTAGMIGFALLATGRPWGHVVGAPIAFAAGWGWPGLFNLAVVRASPRAPGAATGVTQTGTYLGAGAGPLLFGLVAERSSYPTAWITMLAFTLLGVLALVVAARRLHREGRPT
ncbi:MAG: MFS transporter [Myxococcota bacterium]